VGVFSLNSIWHAEGDWFKTRKIISSAGDFQVQGSDWGDEKK